MSWHGLVLFLLADINESASGDPVNLSSPSSFEADALLLLAGINEAVGGDPVDLSSPSSFEADMLLLLAGINDAWGGDPVVLPSGPSSFYGHSLLLLSAIADAAGPMASGPPTPLFSGLYTPGNGSTRTLTLPVEATVGTLLVIVAGYQSVSPFEVWSTSTDLTTVEEYVSDTGTSQLRHHTWTYVVQPGDAEIVWTGETEGAVITLTVFGSGCTVNTSSAPAFGSTDPVSITTTEPSWILFSATRAAALPVPYWLEDIQVNASISPSLSARTRYADGVISQGSSGLSTATRSTTFGVSVQVVAIESPA